MLLVAGGFFATGVCKHPARVHFVDLPHQSLVCALVRNVSYITRPLM